MSETITSGNDTNGCLSQPDSGGRPNEMKIESNCHKVLLVSALIGDARDGCHSDYKTDLKSVRFYVIYQHWALRWMLTFFVVLHHCLAIFENFKRRRDADQWESLSLTLEIICLVFYSIRMIHLFQFLPATVFWRDKKNVILILAIALTFLDLIVYLSYPLAIRVSPVLRPLFIINFAENKQVK